MPAAVALEPVAQALEALEVPALVPALVPVLVLVLALVAAVPALALVERAEPVPVQLVAQVQAVEPVGLAVRALAPVARAEPVPVELVAPVARAAAAEPQKRRF